MALTPNISLVQEAPLVGRIQRRPKHSFNVKHQPFTIQPIMIAPVIPGETMTNLLLQSRVLTDPISNGQIGWWIEYYFFYVKLRDLASRVDWLAMLVEGTDPIAKKNNTAPTAWSYRGRKAVDWVSECLTRVTEEYFRDEGEAIGTLINDLPLAAIPRENVLNNLTLDSAHTIGDHEGSLLPGQDLLLDRYEDIGPLPGYEQHYELWSHMRASGLTDATFADFLRSYGVTPPAEVEAVEPANRPELIRYIRDWSYPSNIVDAAGTTRSALVWSVAERADKRRFLQEPGFIFGVSVCRPKVYLAGQEGALAGYMSDALSWLPAVLEGEAYTSLRKFVGHDTATNRTGPFAIGTAAGDYWLDIRDLLIYGDQFLAGFDKATIKHNAVVMPTTAGAKRFVSSTDIQNLFAGSAYNVHQDGVVNLNILGKQRDTTPN